MFNVLPIFCSLRQSTIECACSTALMLKFDCFIVPPVKCECKCSALCGLCWQTNQVQFLTHACVRSSTWWVRTRNGHKVGRTHFSIGGTYTKTSIWLLIILIDMHWWDLNSKSFRRFSATKNTY